MAIAVVAHAIAGSSDNNNVTSAGIDTTGASLIVIVLSMFGGGGTITPTDNKGNTWTPRTSYGTASDVNARLFYCASPSVGSGHTFTATTSGLFPGLSIIALSGCDPTPYDVENGNHDATTSTIQPGSVSPSVDNEIIIAGYSGYSQGLSGIDSSFTLLDNITYDGKHLTTGLAYLIQTTKGAVNPTWTAAGSNTAAAASATFKAAAAGAGVHPWWTYAGPMMGHMGRGANV